MTRKHRERRSVLHQHVTLTSSTPGTAVAVAAVAAAAAASHTVLGSDIRPADTVEVVVASRHTEAVVIDN